MSSPLSSLALHAVCVCVCGAREAKQRDDRRDDVEKDREEQEAQTGCPAAEGEEKGLIHVYSCVTHTDSVTTGRDSAQTARKAVKEKGGEQSKCHSKRG